MSNAITAMSEKCQKTMTMWLEKAEEERQFLSLLNDITPGLPEGLPYTNAHQHATYCNAVLNLEVKTFAEARAVIEALPPVAAVQERTGCLAFKPAENTKEEGKRTPIFPVWADFDNVTSPKLDLKWFARVNGVLVRCECSVKDVYQLANWRGTKTMTHGCVVMKNKSFHHKLTGHRTNWWTPEDSHMKVTVYWPEGVTLDDVFTVKEYAS